MYDYKAKVLKVVDGATLHLEVDLGLDIRQRITVRLAGINCPEMSTPEGLDAKRFAEAWLATYSARDILGETWVRITTEKDKREKYGRYLANVLSWEVDASDPLNDVLVASGHAAVYRP
jgi:micrococcal nuclease